MDILVGSVSMIGRQIVDQWSQRVRTRLVVYWWRWLPLPSEQATVDAPLADRRASPRYARETRDQLQK